MTFWSEVFLGIIAVASLATAVVQVGVLVAAGLLARRVTRLVDHVEREMMPIFGHLDAIGRDAAKAAALATAQVERVDRVFADVALRLETLLAVVQEAVVRPARHSRAVASGFRAALRVLRDLRRPPGRPRSRADDEDALFI